MEYVSWDFSVFFGIHVCMYIYIRIHHYTVANRSGWPEGMPTLLTN